MTRRNRWGRAAIAAAVVVGLWACGPSAEERAKQELAAKQEADWGWLQTTKKELDAKRQQAGSTAAAGLEKLQDEFAGRLADFINSLGLEQDQTLSGRALEAIRMKSAEDLLLAREYVEEGGEYQKAIDILEASLNVDPDNPALANGLAEFKRMRYPTREKFAQLKKGMAEAEVRTLLGPVNLRNIKEYPERGVVAWFYKKEDGGASAIYFDKKKDGPLKVYDFKFDAVAAGEQGG